MQSEVNQKENLNRIITVPNLLVNFEYRAPLARETSPTLTEI